MTGWSISGMACAAVLATCVGVPAGHASVQNLDWNAAHDLTAPLSRFITHHTIALADVESLSRFRSGYGHGFSDEYGAPDRSMKHYIAPLPAFRHGNNTSLRVHAPVRLWNARRPRRASRLSSSNRQTSSRSRCRMP